MLSKSIESATSWCQPVADSTRRISRVARPCLYKNCMQVIEKKQWPPNNCPNLNTIEISWLGSDERSYFETFIRIPKYFLI